MVFPIKSWYRLSSFLSLVAGKSSRKKITEPMKNLDLDFQNSGKWFILWFYGWVYTYLSCRRKRQRSLNPCQQADAGSGQMNAFSSLCATEDFSFNLKGAWRSPSSVKPWVAHNELDSFMYVLSLIHWDFRFENLRNLWSFSCKHLSISLMESLLGSYTLFERQEHCKEAWNRIAVFV